MVSSATRSHSLFNPEAKTPFKLSRSKIDLFLRCPRCFYLDRRLGVAQPPGFPFNLNSAVDKLLKKEFDLHRAKKTAHPLMKAYQIKAVPFAHAQLDEWRENFKGVQYHEPKSGFLVTGAVDDLWIKDNQELIVVDYKATAKEREVTIDAPWQDSYKRQLEVYQWLLRKNGFLVSDRGYFVYANGRTDREAFDGKLEFDVKVIPYDGDDAWVEPTLLKARATLEAASLPPAAPDCEYCQYRAAAAKAGA
ncbi:MAG: PD-(D/E)XK nuclease family protein [Candidatus Kerfeldbacteria bacterium]|nr:PD-(D/E)XK nuclease family protein [Candidatus Kerfeldbacteria bacterium]